MQTQRIFWYNMGRSSERGEDVKKEEKAVELFKAGCNCSQSVFAAFADEFNLDEQLAIRISLGLGGGVGRMRECCGAVSGAALVLGLRHGPDKSAAYHAIQKFCADFKEECGSIVCRELLVRQVADSPESSKESSAGVQIGGSPEPRTPEYYRKRPCVDLVRLAARLLSTQPIEESKNQQ